MWYLYSLGLEYCTFIFSKLMIFECQRSISIINILLNIMYIEKKTMTLFSVSQTWLSFIQIR